MSDDEANNVRVCIRVRPMNATEEQRGDGEFLDIGPDFRTVKVTVPVDRKRSETQCYAFDAAFPPGTSQLQVFHHSGVEALCDFALEGFASTVFCFGQTGSGKTFTMSGPQVAAAAESAAKNYNGTAPSSDEDQLGLQYRATHYLCEAAARVMEAEGPGSITLRASFYEVYNEQVNDLLNETTDLAVRFSQETQRFFIESLMLVRCDNLEDMLAVLEQGAAIRKRSAHLMNVDSSRSHVVYSVTVERQSPGHPPKFGKINFVDLAGSEKLKDSGSTGSMATETKAINRSLFTLGKVISALATKGGSAFVPYRDSTLTRLLMDSIGGDCRTLMVACVSPSNKYMNETLSTLRYAARTRSIVNRTPVVRVDPKMQQVYELRTEIDRLREENAQLRRLLELQNATAGGPPVGQLPPTPNQSSGLLAPPRGTTTPLQSPGRAPMYSTSGSTSPGLPPSRDAQPGMPPRPASDLARKPPMLAPMDVAPTPASIMSPTTASNQARQATEIANRVRDDNERLREEVAALRKLVLDARMNSSQNSSPTKGTIPPKSTSASLPVRPKLPSIEANAMQPPSSAPLSTQSSASQQQEAAEPFGFRPAPKKATRLFFLGGGDSTAPTPAPVAPAPVAQPTRAPPQQIQLDEEEDAESVRRQLEDAQRELMLYRMHYPAQGQ